MNLYHLMSWPTEVIACYCSSPYFQIYLDSILNTLGLLISLYLNLSSHNAYLRRHFDEVDEKGGCDV